MRTILHDLSKATLSMSSTPIPVPNFANNEHLLRVLAVAPCAGELSWPRPSELNVSVPGVDGVGIVVTAPPTSTFKPGNRCYYRTTYPSPGSLREYAIATTAELALAPANLTATDAAAVPVSALTAWQALFEQWKLQIPASSSATTTSKPRLLINGATGSVGLWMLQLARFANLTTIATASPKNMDLVKAFGADEIIDYTTTSPAEYVSNDESLKFDYIFNAVGGPITALWPTLTKNGSLLTIAPPVDMDFFNYRPAPTEEQVKNKEVEEGLTGMFFLMHPDGKGLGEISKLIEEGKCKALVDSVFDFEEASVKKAFERVDSGRSKGKVVIKVSDEDVNGAAL
jgi:NADPH:quinone reductase-like Zn-dependent oxidoreductase